MLEAGQASKRHHILTNLFLTPLTKRKTKGFAPFSGSKKEATPLGGGQGAVTSKVFASQQKMSQCQKR